MGVEYIVRGQRAEPADPDQNDVQDELRDAKTQIAVLWALAARRAR